MSVGIDKCDGMAPVTRNRPEQLNALNGEMDPALTNGFADLAQHDAVRAAILKRASSRIFRNTGLVPGDALEGTARA